MKLTMAFLILCSLTATSAGQKSDRVYKIYFVPIGNASGSEIDGLVVHYRQKFRLESTILPALTPGPHEIDPNRHQLIAENVVTLMYRTYSRHVANGSSILIGVTSDDMYPLGQNWQFCFGWREQQIRSAVVSTARMNLHYEGEPASEANETSRLQKVVTKDIGITYYNLPPSDNPRSVLFNGILGIQELDRASEDF
jgi:predicted Zn-dependent protease